MDVKAIYTSCACNSTPQTLDWGYNNIICYAACNSVVLYDPKGNGGTGAVVYTLVHHKDQVNCVRWIRKGTEPETAFLSASVDKTVTVWSKEQDRFIPVAVLTGHACTVATADAILTTQSEEPSILLASGSSDSTVRIWDIDCAHFSSKCSQVINVSDFALDIRLTLLPETNVPLLAHGGTDMLVHCYYRNTEGVFLRCHTLQGYEDWVRSLDFKVCGDNSLLLAVASQDSLIRIWKISSKEPENAQAQKKALPDNEVKVRERLFVAEDRGSSRKFSVTLETVLAGHENWVHSASWCPEALEGKCSNSQHSLLSASMDATLIIWEPDEVTGLWMDKVRLGKVGGSTLGFHGAVFGPDRKCILAHGFQGSFHMWNYQENNGTFSWVSAVPPGGHSDKVEDISWDFRGNYLLSCSKDKTTRLHAPWITPEGTSWKEVARPQVHGHNMSCIAALDNLRFISGAEEKVLRAFEGTCNFVENFKRICGVDLLLHSDIKELAKGASVPSLGLSNKAVYEKDLFPEDSNGDQEKHPKDQYPEFYFTPVTLNEPPAEEILMQNTLWHEVRKLYGHGYELFSVAATHNGKLVASTCKASTQQHAAIILWDTTSWKQVGQLIFHTLTITQMAFSPDDRFLLSVSRDRSWCVHEICLEDFTFSKIAYSDKKTTIHQRIIWSCSWSHNSAYFATASRDKKVILWGRRADVGTYETCLGPFESKAELSVEDSATAIDFAPGLSMNNRYLVAIGLENGAILLYQWCEALNWTLCHKLASIVAHHLTVRRLKFSPLQRCKEELQSAAFRLASCGDDKMLRIYEVPR